MYKTGNKLSNKAQIEAKSSVSGTNRHSHNLLDQLSLALRACGLDQPEVEQSSNL